jgi:hypothetical protein
LTKIINFDLLIFNNHIKGRENEEGAQFFLSVFILEGMISLSQNMKLLPPPIMFHLVLFICCFYFGRAIDCGGKQVVNTINVDQQRKGAFQTIQAAIDSIKNPNDRWVMININPGIYK